jgi:hypothetical protein
VQHQIENVTPNCHISAFEADLEREVVSETSGDFKRLVISLLQGNRDESEVVNKEEAKEDAVVSAAIHLSNLAIEIINHSINAFSNF